MSFNGAAVLGPRRARRDWRDRAAATGRFNGAAVLGPRRARRRSSYERAKKGFNGAAVLGPRRVVPARGVGAETLCFNGAAVLGPRRGKKKPRERVKQRASMGPRSWDRGESEERIVAVC